MLNSDTCSQQPYFNFSVASDHSHISVPQCGQWLPCWAARVYIIASYLTTALPPGGASQVCSPSRGASKGSSEGEALSLMQRTDFQTPIQELW